MINVDDDGDAGDDGDDGDGDGGDVDDDGDDGDYDDDDDGDDGEREDECSSRSIRMSSRAQPLRPLTMNILSIEQLITIIIRLESEIFISHLSSLEACLKANRKSTSAIFNLLFFEQQQRPTVGSTCALPATPFCPCTVENMTAAIRRRL